MKYWIATNYFAAPTCDLTKEQFDKFYKSCLKMSKNCNEALNDIPEDERIRLLISYRKSWRKLLREDKYENDLAHGVIPLQNTVTIYPEHILGDASLVFTHKKAAYRRYKKDHDGLKKEYPVMFHSMLEDMKRIEYFLRYAKELRDNYRRVDQSTEQIPQTNSTKSPSTVVPSVSPAISPSTGTAQAKASKGRPINDRSLWVIKQYKMELSNKAIYEKWNKMTHAERKDFAPGTYKKRLPNDKVVICYYGEKFNSISNVHRIVNDYKKRNDNEMK